MLDAAPVDNLALLLEFLASGAVEPLVLRDVQIVRMKPLYPLQQLRHRAKVARFRGPNPVIVAAVEPSPKVGKAGCHAVNPVLRRDTGLGGSLQDRLAVLVHAHDEVDLIAAHAAVPGDAVGADLLQGVPQMGVAVGVIDGGGQVKLRHPRSSEVVIIPPRT
jgi:hypothetical protein